MSRGIFVALALALLPGAALAAPPAAIFTDPVPDKANPARMEVVHIPSGGVEINGVVYIPTGAGPHPTVVLCHGLPGNEKNLDLAQALRRAGWTVVTFNYRGSWGSPGSFRFAQNLEDADAVLAFVRNPANAARLGIDPRRIVMIGHSMGGWVTTLTAGHDKGLLGAVLISAANMSMFADILRTEALAEFRGDMETLADTSPDREVDEIAAHHADFDFMRVAPALKDTPLLILSADDGLAPSSDKLASAIKAAGGTKLTSVHVATDHSWSDSRIRLESEIIDWLETLH